MHGFQVTLPNGTQDVTQTAKLTGRTKQIWLYWSDPWESPTNSYTLHVYVQRLQKFLPVEGADSVLRSPARRAAVYVDATTIPGLNCDGSTAMADNCFEPGDLIAITKDYLSRTQQSESRFLRLYSHEGAIDVGTTGRASGRNAAENVISVGAVVPPPTLTESESRS